jgi:hypothetical protein
MNQGSQQSICLLCEPHGINLPHQQTIVVWKNLKMVSIVSNLETLMGTMTHQGPRKVVLPTWHDVDYE